MAAGFLAATGAAAPAGFLFCQHDQLDEMVAKREMYKLTSLPEALAANLTLPLTPFGKLNLPAASPRLIAAAIWLLTVADLSK